MALAVGRTVLVVGRRPPKLPQHWAEVLDEKTGYIYYWNTDTNATTWVLPDEHPVLQSAAPPPPLPPLPPLPAGQPVTQPAAPQPGLPTITIDAPPASARSNPLASPAMSTSRAKHRHKAVVAESMTHVQRARVYVPKSETSKQCLRATLNDHFLFTHLKPSDVDEMVGVMTEVRVSKGQALITQGDHGDNMYVCESGSFEIFVQGVGKVADRGPNSAFGELALLYNAPRSATVVAATDSLCWALDRVTFRHMIASHSAEEQADVVSMMRRVPFAASLTESQLTRLAEAVKVRQYIKGDNIIVKGEEADCFFIIKAGRVKCIVHPGTDNHADDRELGPGDHFGERSLLYNAPRAATVTAISEKVACLTLDRDSFQMVLGPVKEVLYNNLILAALKTIAAFGVLDTEEMEEVVRCFEVETVEPGTSVIGHDEIESQFVVLLSGSAELRFDEETRVNMSEGDIVGEGCLVEGVSDPAGFDLVTISKCDVGKLPVNLFTEQICSLADLAARQRTAKPGGAAAAKRDNLEESKTPRTGTPRRELRSMRLSDLKVIRNLGRGAFGLVQLVVHNDTGLPYALKSLDKQQLCEQKQQAAAVHEKQILSMLNHPFILALEATFQDPKKLYMVLEFIQGGELFSLQGNQPNEVLLPEWARFYCACCVCALEAMHKQDILYRDLKPENVLIDGRGYVRIVDFGFAKVVSDRTYTLCGTPEYMAPELVLGKGYGKGADYWALGILLYEMLVGQSPFADSDQMRVARNIVIGKIQFPPHVSDAATKDLIQGFLTRDMIARLGCRRDGVSEIKKHPYFESISWMQLLAKTLEAPWQPDVRDPLDATYFEGPEADSDVDGGSLAPSAASTPRGVEQDSAWADF